MTETTYGRMLAIKAAAAGPYRITGRCHDCGEEEGLVNFPRPFAVSIAICRRCRFNRTGIEDRRGMIHGTATVAGAPRISGPPTDGEIGVGIALEFERRMIEGDDRRPGAGEPVGIFGGVDLGRPEGDWSGVDPDLEVDRGIIVDERERFVEDIFAPWTDDDDEKRD